MSQNPIACSTNNYRIQRQDTNPARPRNLQQGHDWRLPSGHCERRCRRALDWIWSYRCRILPTRRFQVRRIRALQATVYQLPWLRDCLEQPNSCISRFVRPGRVLCRYCALPIRSYQNSIGLTTYLCDWISERLRKDCQAGGRRCFLLGLRTYSLQAVS